MEKRPSVWILETPKLLVQEIIILMMDQLRTQTQPCISALFNQQKELRGLAHPTFAKEMFHW